MISKQELFVKGKKWFHSLSRIMISILPAKLLIYILKEKKSLLYKGEAPLHFVAQYGCTKAAKLLIQNSSEIDIKDHNSRTPLHFAAQAGRAEVVKLLIQSGADIDAVNEHGNTPMILAALRGHKEVVELLIQKGANLDVMDKNGAQPIHLAAFSGNIDLVKYLLNEGADVNAKNKDGFQPIHAAAQNGHIKAVKHLIDKGAKVDAKDNNGTQPIHAAAQDGHKKLIESLRTKIGVRDKSNGLFSITECDNTFNPVDEYCKLFQHKQGNTFNDIIPKYISKIALLTDIYKNNIEEKFTKDTANVSDQIARGLCNSLSYLIALLQLNSKKDFDELYNLMNFDEKELNEENLKKFLEGKLDNQKTKGIFELIQTIVEYSFALELGSINDCSDCKEQLPIKYIISDSSDNCYDISSSKIIINRSVISNILKELKNGDSMSYVISNINTLSTFAHAMSITKTCNGQYIFFDSNMPCALEISSKEEVCKVMELAFNKYCRQIYDLKSKDYCFPGIRLINLTETIKAAMEHYANHQADESKDKPSSLIWDISIEACNRGITRKSKVDGILI